MAFLLTKNSVILCPHGGRVMHHPTSFSGKLIDGAMPMLLNDVYNVVGCQFKSGISPGIFPSPCIHVNWANGSKTRLINGIPVLTNASVGICKGAAGTQGQAIIASCQSRESD
jgi:hypothetical protein